MASDRSRVRAYFGVTGAGKADEISRRLRMSPTNSWSAGDPRPRWGGIYPTTCWQLQLFETNRSLSEQVTALLDHLLPHADDIRSLRPDFATWLVCVGHYSEYQTGGLSIDLAAIKAMAQMELALDFDFYCGHVPEGNA